MFQVDNSLYAVLKIFLGKALGLLCQWLGQFPEV